MKRPLTLFGVSALVLGLLGCDALRDYPKNIQEFPEPWRVLDPGKPLDKFPKIEVIKEGSGPVIEAGDLTQIHVHFIKPSTSLEIDRGDIWVWMGFRSSKETAFFSYEPAAASSMVGLKEGTVFKFIEPKAERVSPPWYAGEIYLLTSRQYRRQKAPRKMIERVEAFSEFSRAVLRSCRADFRPCAKVAAPLQSA